MAWLHHLVLLVLQLLIRRQCQFSMILLPV
uniref:Uncharacterized protein n=1 Tax=Arundo donax TaxID=35708 RepID=A0A0A8ZNA6_ARUDO